MNILLLLFNLIYGFIKDIINIRYFFWIKIRKNFLDKKIPKEKDMANLFSLLFKIFILSIYEFCVFNLYIFLYLITDSSIEIKLFGIILRFLLIFGISSFLTYLIGEVENIFIYLIELIKSLFHLLLWICSLFLFIVTFNEELLAIILFRKKVDTFIEILTLFVSVFIISFEQIFRYVLILSHLIHILSILRLVETHKIQKKKFLMIYYLFPLD